MTEHYGLILDSLVVILLIATIVYAAMLNRRLAGLRDNRAELEQAVRSFGEAAGKADAGIKALKRTAEETGQRLQKDVDRGEALKDELSLLVETAELLADRLEAAAGGSRGGSARAARAKSQAAPAAAPAGKAQGASGSVNGAAVGSAAGPAPAPRAAAAAAKPAPAPADGDVLRAIETMR